MWSQHLSSAHSWTCGHKMKTMTNSLRLSELHWLHCPSCRLIRLRFAFTFRNIEKWWQQVEIFFTNRFKQVYVEFNVAWPSMGVMAICGVRSAGWTWCNWSHTDCWEVTRRIFSINTGNESLIQVASTIKFHALNYHSATFCRYVGGCSSKPCSNCCFILHSKSIDLGLWNIWLFWSMLWRRACWQKIWMSVWLSFQSWHGNQKNHIRHEELWQLYTYIYMFPYNSVII